MKLLGLTYYLTVSEFLRPQPLALTLDTEALTTSFDDAVTRYGDARKDGSDARVYEVDFTRGTLTDVSDAATERLQYWCNLRGLDFPAWMTEPDEDDRAQRGYDAAKEAA